MLPHNDNNIYEQYPKRLLNSHRTKIYTRQDLEGVERKCYMAAAVKLITATVVNCDRSGLSLIHI